MAAKMLQYNFSSLVMMFFLFVLLFKNQSVFCLRPRSNDHKAFLGKMKEEFDVLPLQEAKRRLR